MYRRKTMQEPECDNLSKKLETLEDASSDETSSYKSTRWDSKIRRGIGFLLVLLMAYLIVIKRRKYKKYSDKELKYDKKNGQIARMVFN